MSTTVPLHRHTRVWTTDIDEAQSAAGQVMSSHRLRVRDPEEFGARLHAVEIGSSTLLYATYHGEVAVTGLAPMEYYTLQLILAGAVDVVTDFGEQRAGQGQACVVSPGERVRLRFAAGTVQIAAKLPRHVVEQGYARLGAEPPGRLVFGLAVADDAPWPGQLRLAVTTVDRFDTGVLPPGAGRELERMLVTSLLLSQPHDHAGTMFRGGGTRGYRAAGTAAEALTADPVPYRAPEELACAAGVSLRTLQEGFRSRFGTTVTGYQRELRLERAHRMLSTMDDKSSVADIALACGFFHFGRFARDYRLRYGTTPSTTLRSSRTADRAARSG
ncbi:AraC family transcriptional regulator [Amycolatopsis jiangsuensis]|uniref:AraC-like DNA-binding protein n=1 Tax=Amycolatopsis jiangsuensis TaxID=1181879 RepID=A0A840IS31_9PSEU|nr:AraC family transcriptional regulator [Amycolatopsis jiangsuensis]MBB4683824.1 AraC-like DNA-binding protein [Amycolatopsis jiangsuensis]